MTLEHRTVFPAPATPYEFDAVCVRLGGRLTYAGKDYSSADWTRLPTLESLAIEEPVTRRILFECRQEGGVVIGTGFHWRHPFEELRSVMNSHSLSVISLDTAEIFL